MNLYNSRLINIQKISDALKNRIDFLGKKSNKFSGYRLAVFIAGLIIIIAGFLYGREAGMAAVIISAAAFSITVHFHNKLLTGIKRHSVYLKIKNEHLHRMKIDWENIPLPVSNENPGELSLGKDLDLCGKRSLHHLIDNSVSLEGSRLLSDMLTNSLRDKEEIIYRQNIIRELSQFTRFRDRFILKSRLISKKNLECGKILGWLQTSEDDYIPGYVLPVSAILILLYAVLFITGTLELTGSVWLIPFLIYFFIYSSQKKKLDKIAEDSSELESQFRKFTSLIYFISDFAPVKSIYLKEFLESSFGSSTHARENLKSLQKITSAFLLRENAVARLVLNLIFPFDIYFSLKLIKIKSSLKENIPFWLERLNELECYISLSNFTFLNPDYVFPVISGEKDNVFETLQMGHPLIKRDVKICNDFSLKKENEILIITGSNMSGKSTFLKSTGINLCLAYAGGPVNAENMKVTLYDLFTCIKVNDSVSDGISYFYAEVKRLKMLLDEFSNKKNLPVFFLIDEIFKGTNNRERLSGSRAFIKKLAELKGTGAVTTHDLELVNLADEISGITNYHFREEIENDKMKFDYKIHPGPCPTTNALKIMEISGLPVE
jgi:DNA mismatch repair ATPase MutS